MISDIKDYKWKPIEDLPSSPETLAIPELQALAQVWKEQREELEKAGAVQEFLEKQKREWAIETGIIEHLYTLDRGTTLILIEKGINADLIPRQSTDQDPELVAHLIQDQKTVVDGLFSFITGERTLTTGYIKELHAALTRHQETTEAVNGLGRHARVPLIHGEYKKQPNNPTRPDGSIHEYCPPEQVTSEMDRLVAFHRAHLENSLPPEVGAAWLHHRFAQIHPFQDGNGRIARALATLVFIKAYYFPLTVHRDDRERYIDALEAADQGDIRKLIGLFAAIEKRAFVNAMGIAREVLQHERVHQVINAVKDTFSKRHEVQLKEWEKSKNYAGKLQNNAVIRLKETEREINSELKELKKEMRKKGTPLTIEYEIFVDKEDDMSERSHYFRDQIIETARKLGYYANTHVYRSWARIVLKTDSQAELLLSFHGVGHDFRGVLAVSAFFFRREATEENEREVVGLSPLSDEIFQINYREPYKDIEKRFNHWLEDILVKGLETWRKTL